MEPPDDGDLLVEVAESRVFHGNPDNVPKYAYTKEAVVRASTGNNPGGGVMWDDHWSPVQHQLGGIPSTTEAGPGGPFHLGCFVYRTPLEVCPVGPYNPVYSLLTKSLNLQVHTWIPGVGLY